MEGKKDGWRQRNRHGEEGMKRWGSEGERESLRRERKKGI